MIHPTLQQSSHTEGNIAIPQNLKGNWKETYPKLFLDQIAKIGVKQVIGGPILITT